jgi:transketolase
VHGLPGPAYTRLSKSSFTVPGCGDGFELGRAHRIGDGEDVAIIALGGMAATAVAAAELLVARGINASVLVVECVSPPPVEDLVTVLGTVPLAVSIEAHYVTGGLGSLVAEVIADRGLPCRLVRTGAQRQPIGIAGSREFMHDLLGLSPERFADAILDAQASVLPRARASPSSPAR